VFCYIMTVQNVVYVLCINLYTLKIYKVLFRTPYIMWVLAILTEGFCDSPKSPLADAGIFSRLGHDRFFPNPFQFIIHQLPYILG
jgi:hypothetical protein